MPATQPTDAIIPISSLATGNYAANNWAGFTTPASTIYNPANSGWACGSGGSNNFFEPRGDGGGLSAISTGLWRDAEITTWVHRGTLYLRMANGSALACFINGDANSCNGLVQMGIVQNFVPGAGNTDFGGSGAFYWAYINENPTATLAGYSNSYSPGDTVTFGASGFNVYLKINGVLVAQYTEWRLMQAGNAAVFGHEFYNVAGEIFVHYMPLQSLYSEPLANIYDPRDFGMRALAAVTGSMSADSNQLVLSSNPGFLAGDRIIVEIGGEPGAGARGTVGVGGTWPSLSYANATLMNADTSQEPHTSCYLQSTNLVWSWNGTQWVRGIDQFPTLAYYPARPVPVALLATITAVNGNTLTLSANSVAASTNANVWLDCVPSFLVINQELIPVVGASGNGQFAPNPSNMTISIPAGDWRLSGIIGAGSASAVTTGLKIHGQGSSLTTLHSPKGCTSGAINLEALSVNNVSISDIAYVGNFGSNGFMFQAKGNIFINFPYAFTLYSPGAVNTGLVIRNIVGTNTFGQCCGCEGNAPLISNCSTTLTSGHRDYVGWQFQLVDSANGTIENCTVAGPYTIRAFEAFACNGCTIKNCGGQNTIFSTNSSSNTTLDMTQNVTFTANCFSAAATGIDEPIFNINTNAFGHGSGGKMICRPGFRCVQEGYVDGKHNSLKFIQIQPVQTGWTIEGGFPGVGECSESLGGYFEAPDYDPISSEYGAMGVFSQADNTTVKGIRIVGSAIGWPGHSGGYGNIALLGSFSAVANCVADVIKPGPTKGGNQTNAAYLRATCRRSPRPLKSSRRRNAD